MCPDQAWPHLIVTCRIGSSEIDIKRQIFGESDLPYRQLRKVSEGITLVCLRDLPYRQLRNWILRQEMTVNGDLPYRQLRKEKLAAWVTDHSDLPYRQLRK